MPFVRRSALLTNETEKWAKVIKAANIKAK
jgi:hypothetical protein